MGVGALQLRNTPVIIWKPQSGFTMELRMALLNIYEFRFYVSHISVTSIAPQARSSSDCRYTPYCVTPHWWNANYDAPGTAPCRP